MNEKITLQDLTALLAEKEAITKKDAELFLRAYFEIMNEDIIKSGSLKIKDLGSFKLSQMEDRESVDVTTGDRVLIPSHYKVVFTPDKKLAETVNEPFALFETIEIEEEFESEKINLLSDEDASEDSEPTSVEDEIEPTSVEEDCEKIPIIHTEDKTMPDRNLKNICHNCYDYEAHQIYKEKYLKTQNKLKKLRVFTFILLILLVSILGYIGYLYQDEVNLRFKDFLNSTGITRSEQKQPIVQDVPVIVTDSIVTIEKPKEEEVSNKVIQPAAAEIMKQLIVAPGQRLTSIAENEYGDKVFWVYIYIENRAAISNPDILHVGAKIFVPPAEKYGIDSNDPASVQKAKEIANKILKDF